MGTPQLTMEELRRAETWNICLNDALAYIALAKQADGFVTEGALFNYAGQGQAVVAHTIEKGLIAAAITSAGQIFKNGNAGEHIAENHTGNLRKLRDLLFVCSDEANALSKGESERIYDEFVKKFRDGFVSHYDGSSANIVLLNESENAISWRPPNPDFRAEAFSDLEKVLDQMHRSLRAFTNRERLAFRDAKLEK